MIRFCVRNGADNQQTEASVRIRNERRIGIRHAMKASVYGPARPVQVHICEPDGKQSSFALQNDADVERFIAAAIRKDDVILLSASRSAHALTAAVAFRALQVGAETLRIARDDLHDHLNVTTDDMSKVLVNVHRFLPRLFTQVSREWVADYRAKHGLDQQKLQF